MSKLASTRAIGVIGSILGLLIAVCAIGLSGMVFFFDIGHADDGAMLAGNHPIEADSRRQIGEVNPGTGLKMQIRFALRQRKALEKLLAQQQDPASPNYHKWLTHDDFVKRFGPSSAQVKAVSDWLGGEGFAVTKRSANAIEFSGPAARAQRTFAVRIAKFGDGSVYANTADPVIPKRFAGLIGAVTGLDNMLHAVATTHRDPVVDPLRTPGPSAARLTPAGPPLQLALAESGPASEPPSEPGSVVGARAAFGPVDLRNFYNESVVAGADGTGSCIAIIDDSDFLDSTMSVFTNQFAMPAISYTRVLAGANPGINGDEAESELDVQWAHASAPGASIRFYLGSDLIADITGAVNDNACGAISISFSFCGVSSAFMMQTMHPLFMQAAGQGQSIFISSGDQGAANLALNATGNGCVVSSVRSINEMAADPNVTAVGGTSFTPNYVGGIQQGYSVESVWNDGSGATGGGASQIFSKPAYQTGSGVPNDGMRDIPDIALIASPGSPGAFWGHDRNGVGEIACCIGGTSLSAPVWAGFASVIGQMVGNRLGNLNQIIYPLASTQYATAGFHDVTGGNNNFNAVTGFNAGSGYDQSTGWGTIDFNVFANTVKNFVSGASPTPTGSPMPTLTPTATATRTATPTPTATATPISSITFVGAGPLADSSSAVTTVTVGVPAGVHSGDTLLAQIIIYDGTGSVVPAAPSGWTSIRHDSINNGNKATTWLFSKVAGASEPASYGWNIASSFAAGVMGAWRGASGSPIGGSSGAAAAGSSPLSGSAPSLTPANNGELQVYFYGAQAFAGPTITPSSSLTQRFDTSSSKEGFTLAFADRAAPFANTASPTYPATASISGSTVMTAQAVLLIAGSSQGPTPTPASTTTATTTRTPTITATPTTTVVATPSTTRTATPTMTVTATAIATTTSTAVSTPIATTTATPTIVATPTATATPTTPGITFVGAGSLTDSASAVTSVTVGVPAGLHAGDILLAQIVIYDGTASNVPAPPSGWTSIRHDAVNSGNKATSWLYYKVAGGSEPASYTWNIGSNWAAGVMGAWRGAASLPIDNASGATAAGSSPVSASAPSMSPANSNEKQVYFYGSQSFAGPTLTLANALTQRFNTRSSKEGFSLAFADVAAPAAHVASPTYPATASISGTAVLTAQAVLLIPAP